jgi:site-specific DNA-methyltransferase (adenine-specific)
MKLFHEGENYKLYQGTMLDLLKVIEPNSIDSIVTDPPYGLTSITKRFGKEKSAPAQYGKDGSFSRLSKGFMGKLWDGSGIEYNIETWQKCYEALKPGGYLLAFGGTRTFHRIACAIEDAGFEIRDTIMWLYGSGFPKSMNIGLAIDKKNGIENKTGVIKKGVGNNNTDSQSIYGLKFEERIAQNEWGGWGTTLKPSYEPIIVARKPFAGSLIDNIQEYGVGGLNIDECRVGDESHTVNINDFSNQHGNQFGNREPIGKLGEKEVIGRYPANTILTYDDTDFEEVCGGMLYTKSGIAVRHNSGGNTFGGNNKKPPMEDLGYEDSGSAARYFYCAKASTKDRDEGLDQFDYQTVSDGRKTPIDNAFQLAETQRKNTHPTVKPTELMQYLIRMVTPNGGTVLDPFNGSGSTGKAVMYENREKNKGYKYIGIDLEEEYLAISKARIDYVNNIDKQSNLIKVNGVVYEELKLF